ncbi:MAG TPA: hypothetical protein VJU61_14255 [Polyangiaceae bacterium]|nr:hypothetical protein [Polyangiaceae bacterium]
MQSSRWFLGALALCCLGPTPGDIGGCGQTAQDLDPSVFFNSKQSIECTRCDECGLRTPACQGACAGEAVPSEFPAGCFPLVHDGTVCLRALSQASCEQHLQVMSEPPRVPSECNFCPPEAAPD